MTNKDVNTIVNEFLNRSSPNDRYTSFDYCYNYFRTTTDITKDIEKSCLVLGFYLASWGMFRGSSFLLQKSIKHFEPTINYISTLDQSVWNIDVDKYSEHNIDTIISIYGHIKYLLIHENNKDITLITKILLGIFGFVPAFDNYFCKSFREISNQQCGFTRLNSSSLHFIQDFYRSNKSDIDRLSDTTFTTDFITGEKTTINYPKAKIIDMYGFQLSYQESLKQ